MFAVRFSQGSTCSGMVWTAEGRYSVLAVICVCSPSLLIQDCQINTHMLCQIHLDGDNHCCASLHLTALFTHSFYPSLHSFNHSSLPVYSVFIFLSIQGLVSQTAQSSNTGKPHKPTNKMNLFTVKERLNHTNSISRLHLCGFPARHSQTKATAVRSMVREGKRDKEIKKNIKKTHSRIHTDIMQTESIQQQVKCSKQSIDLLI